MNNETSIAPSSLAAALAKAQGEFDPIAKTREVTVRSDKGNYTFAYAPLDEVLACTRPALSRNGLALVQLVTGGGQGETVIKTLLMHASGERLEADIVLPYKPQKAQELGSLLTYLRRYSIVSILGVVAEEDDDGNAAEGNHAEKREHAPSKASPPAAAPPPAKAPPNAPDMALALKLTKILTSKAPDGLGWTKQGALGWLKKRFGVEGTAQMSGTQVTDGIALAEAYLASAKAGDDSLYDAKVAELAAAGRCLADKPEAA